MGRVNAQSPPSECVMRSLSLSLVVSVLAASDVLTQGAVAGPVHGQRATRLVIRNALVYEGNGTPAEGPKDIVIDNGRITQVVAVDAVSLGGRGGQRPAAGTAEIDATGKFVMPGLINAHAHVQEERGGIPQPL